MSGTSDSTNISDIYGFPVLDTWVNGQPIQVDWLNRNVRDPQIFLSYAPLTIVTRNSTQSVPTGTQAATTFDTEIIDTTGMFNGPSTNVTVQEPGIYSIQGCTYWAGSAAGSIRSMHLEVNNNRIASSNVAPSPTTQTIHTAAAIVPLNTGDIISKQIFQDSGGALNTGGNTMDRLAVRMLSTANTALTFDPATKLATSTSSSAGSSTKPTAPSPTKHTATFYATWSRTYNGNGATTWDDSPYCYQGYYSSSRGNTRSLIGFNYSSIQSTLSGATNITGHFGYKVAWSYYNSGLTTVMGSHNYTSKPSTWSTTRVFEDQGKKASCLKYHSYVVPLSSWQCWAWRTGNITGMAFGPGPSTNHVYYGYMYGATQGGKPYVQFTYYK